MWELWMKRPNAIRVGYAKNVIAAVAALAGTLLFSGSAAYAAGTTAGTKIENIAKASYDDGSGGTIEVESNKAIFNVDELLDVTVASADPGNVATSPGETAQVLKYTLTNTGNGKEPFKLSANTAKGGDDFDTVLEQIVLDTNGNGVYDAGVDTVYVSGTNDPDLDPDQSTTIFILSTIPAGATDTQKALVELSAVAATGSGAPGTSFAGQGVGGSDAVVGATGADAEADGTFIIQAAALALVKSATILDQFGGTQSVPGATITYTLVATISGTGTLNNVKITDAIPAQTTYVAESITLESAGLTDDTADADAGSFNGTQISATLGNLPGGQTRTVTFKVKIN